MQFTIKRRKNVAPTHHTNPTCRCLFLHQPDIVLCHYRLVSLTEEGGLVPVTTFGQLRATFQGIQRQNTGPCHSECHIHIILFYLSSPVEVFIYLHWKKSIFEANINIGKHHSHSKKFETNFCLGVNIGHFCFGRMLIDNKLRLYCHCENSNEISCCFLQVSPGDGDFGEQAFLRRLQYDNIQRPNSKLAR